MCKVPQNNTDNLLSLSVTLLSPPTYKYVKFLALLLVPVTTSEFAIKDLFTFAEEFQTLEFKIVMTSFEIELFFTNIPIFFSQKTIDLYFENVFKEKA